MPKFKKLFLIFSFLFLTATTLASEKGSALSRRQGEIIRNRYRLSAQNILAPESYAWNERGGLQFSGTGIGGGLMGSAYQALCNNQIAILSDAFNKANDELDSSGQATVANRILLQGMIAAAEVESPATTYTQIALLRGLELFSALKADNAVQSTERADFLYMALGSYIQEIVIQVAYQTLDRDQIAPWLNRREQLHNDVTQMEYQYVEFAKAQLNFIQEHFAGKTRNSRELVIYPVGVSAKEYLKAIELTSLYAASDLHNSLWRDRFVCATENLLNINTDLRAFNQGNQFGNLRTKLERIFSLTEVAQRQLGQKNSCWVSGSSSI